MVNPASRDWLKSAAVNIGEGSDGGGRGLAPEDGAQRPAEITKKVALVDFSWTVQQSEAYTAARDYGRAHARRSEDGHLHTIDMADWALLARAGIPRLCIPVVFGGEGFDAQTTARAVEGFAYGCDDMGLVFAACAHLFACAMPIAEYGSTDLRRALP